MRRRDLLRHAVVLAAVGAFAGTAAAPPALAQPADAVPQVRVILYDPSGAGRYAEAVRQGAEIWNKHVPEIRLEQGAPATVTFTNGKGWPSAQPTGFGRGRIHMGDDAVAQGHWDVRIASHEIGHILGLPDDRTGRCEDLMAGGSAPASCRSADPNPTEVAKVKRNAGSGQLPGGIPAHIVD